MRDEEIAGGRQSKSRTSKKEAATFQDSNPLTQRILDDDGYKPSTLAKGRLATDADSQETMSLQSRSDILSYDAGKLQPGDRRVTRLVRVQTP